MSIILLISLPIFAIGITIFIGSLITFAINNEINYTFLLISMFVTIITGFLISKNLKTIMPKTVKSLNTINNMDIYYGYFSFILFLLFGLSYLVNYMFTQNVFNLAIGMLCFSFFIYITYAFFGYKKEIELKIKTITEITKDIYQLSLVDSDFHEYIYFINKDLNLHADMKLKFLYYKYTKMIKIKKDDLNGSKQ